MTDDLDGSDHAQPVTFEMNGASYVVHLTAQNLAQLYEALRPFIDHATRLPLGCTHDLPRAPT